MSPTPHFDDLTPAMGRYVGGDRSAFGVIYRRLAPWLRLHLRKLLAGRSDDQLIDDLMQTTFLKLHDLRHTWVKGSPVAPWVLVIARHLAIDELRRHRFAASEQVPEPVASSEPSQHTLLELYELTERLSSAFAGLPRSQARAFELVRLDGLDSASAARLLDTSAVAVRLRCLRATQSLKAAIV